MISQVERFDTWRQREALISLAESSQFLGTAEGAAFIEQLQVFFVRGMCKFAWDALQVQLEENEIVNCALTGLMANDGRIARYAAAADENPWGYVATCLKRWIRELTGIQGVDLEKVAAFLPVCDASVDHGLTPLDEVVEKSYIIMREATPQTLHEPLFRLLEWLAENPIQRLSYEAPERVAAGKVVPEMTAEQVKAVMNIAWGGRPRQAETSIMGALLIDPHFRVTGSSTHLRALAHYKAAMRVDVSGGQLISDWN